MCVSYSCIALAHRSQARSLRDVRIYLSITSTMSWMAFCAIQRVVTQLSTIYKAIQNERGRSLGRRFKQSFQWPPMTSRHPKNGWPVWEATFNALWKLDPFFMGLLIMFHPLWKGSLRGIEIKSDVYLHFFARFQRLVQIKWDKKFCYGLLMHVFFCL